MARHDRLRAAFDRVRRSDFLPPEQRGFAREDAALPIGYGQTNSQPSTVRAMLELLEVAPGQRVLDVGCGSGWTTALLGELTGPAGEVVGVEIVPELVAWGAENLRAYAMPWTRIVQADEKVLGVPEGAPYDRVLVSAEATRVPEELLDQLVIDGLMVVPVRGRMTVVRRSASAPQVSHAGWYTFVPLVEP
jgi:protein-L-isoaspartate(D-aspartate) O-methyltransferase